jgi:hypothetical protein
VNAPWVAPGGYSVRLTVNGKSQTQPITVKMDPRVKVTPEVQQVFTLTTQMETNAMSAAAAYQEARDLTAKMKSRPQSAANDALVKDLEAIAPAEPTGGGGGGRGGRGGGGGGFGEAAGPAPAADLSNIGTRMVAAVQPMQGSEMAPTKTELDAAAREQAAYTALMAKWTALKAKASGQTASPAAKK